MDLIALFSQLPENGGNSRALYVSSVLELVSNSFKFLTKNQKYRREFCYTNHFQYYPKQARHFSVFFTV
jgi:hypothetical protein